jgi:hypothetical protein
MAPSIDLRDELWGLAEDVDESPAFDSLYSDFDLRPWEHVLEIAGPGSSSTVAPHMRNSVVRIESHAHLAKQTQCGPVFDVALIAPEAEVGELDQVLDAVYRCLAGGGRVLGRIYGRGHLGMSCCANALTPARLAQSLELCGLTPSALMWDWTRRPLVDGHEGLYRLQGQLERSTAVCGCSLGCGLRGQKWNGRQWSVPTSTLLFSASKEARAAASPIQSW